MLVLTRRPGESIVIGEEIVVTVLEVRGESVRLGITAPREIPVHREEVFAQIKAENIAAAGARSVALEALEELLRTGKGSKIPGSGGRSWGDPGE